MIQIIVVILIQTINIVEDEFEADCECEINEDGFQLLQIEWLTVFNWQLDEWFTVDSDQVLKERKLWKRLESMCEKKYQDEKEDNSYDDSDRQYDFWKDEQAIERLEKETA